MIRKIMFFMLLCIVQTSVCADPATKLFANFIKDKERYSVQYYVIQDTPCEDLSQLLVKPENVIMITKKKSSTPNSCFINILFEGPITGGELVYAVLGFDDNGNPNRIFSPKSIQLPGE